MSKSSSNDDINIAYLDKLTEAVVDMTVKLDKISSNYGSNGQLEQTIRKLAQEVNSGSMSLKQMLKEASATQKNIRSVEYGLEDTTKYNKTVNMFLKLLEERMGDSKIDEVLVEKITTAFENLDVSAILESEKIEQRGGKGAPLKNTLDNEKLGRVNEDLARRIGLSLDTTTDKLITFFQEQEKKREKKTRGFVDDLIEGLEKSKWVGGALQDTFRLIGLLGANWLSKFGQLGRILGGAFYVAMATAGPLLVKLLLQGIGKLLTSLPGMLGNLGKGLWGGAVRLSTNMGGPLSMFTPGRWGMMSGAGKAASVGRLAGAGLAAGALGTGAFFAGRESYRSFKQGDKVGGSAFGVGAAGLGVAAIAAIVAGVAAPVTLIAAAVGGIAVGVAAIWKNREKILEHYKKNKDFYDKVIDFIALWNPIFRIIQWIRDNWPFGGKGTGGRERSTHENAIQNFAESQFHSDKIGKLKVAQDKSMLNLKNLSHAEAQKAVEDYQATDIEGFNSLYEIVPSKYAAVGTIKKDVTARNIQTGEMGMLSYKGASSDMQKIRDMFIQRAMGSGMSERAARALSEKLLFTGGVSSKDSEHSPSEAGHASRYGYGFDIGLAGLTSEQQAWALAAAQRVLGQAGRGQKAWFETKQGGRYKLTEGVVSGANPLIHVQAERGGYVVPEAAIRNRENYEKAKSIKSTNDMMTVAEVVKNLPEADKRAFGDELKKVKAKDSEKLLKEEERILRDMGIYKSDELQGSPWVRKNKDGTESLLKDATGNIMFTSDYMQSIANKGV